MTTTSAPARSLAAAALDLARWFHGGATLWCAAPQWPAHARHLAVEFVHPVIVGKRALPAAVVPPGHLADQVRVLARPGDVLAGIAAGGDIELADAFRRAPAWAVHTLWLGAGTLPPSGLADHVVWSDADSEYAAHCGELVRLYHVLWELTHVCFEHPGLLTRPDDGGTASCATCADDAVLAEVVSQQDGTATVRMGGALRAVDVSLLDDVGAGALVLVHGGTAITSLDAP